MCLGGGSSRLVPFLMVGLFILCGVAYCHWNSLMGQGVSPSEEATIRTRMKKPPRRAERGLGLGFLGPLLTSLDTSCRRRSDYLSTLITMVRRPGQGSKTPPSDPPLPP